MSTEVKQQLTTLAALQKAENEIANIEKALSGVNAQMEALNQQIDAHDEKINNEQARLDLLRKQYREDEAEIKGIEARALKDQEKLRAVKTNKEYQSMLKEIDDLKKKSSQIEDRMLVCLEDIEQVESDLAKQKKEMITVRSEIEAQQAEIQSQTNIQKETLAQNCQERDAIYSRLDLNLQKMFDKVKCQGRGIAVAAIENGVCLVCRMGIPPQMFNELLRMDTVRLCPNCQRIIYPKIMIEPEENS
jgi:predicted  nucleic acid-binding Zn-ribbon protein